MHLFPSPPSPHSYLFYPAELMAMPLAVLEAAVSTANVLSAPLAAALLQLQGAGGMAGWQWLFIIEVRATACTRVCRRPVRESQAPLPGINRLQAPISPQGVALHTIP